MNHVDGVPPFITGIMTVLCMAFIFWALRSFFRIFSNKKDDKE